MSKIQIPVLVIGFNRPDFLFSILSKLDENKVSEVFVSLDGPRNQAEKSLCTESLRVVLSFSSNFNLHILHREENLGCALGVVSALDWFFSQVEFGIVLEDDCIPDNSFFNYVKEARLKFTVDASQGKVLISGHNPFTLRKSDELSKIVLIHGWATWSGIWTRVRANYFKLDFPMMTSDDGTRRKLREAIYWWSNACRARLGGVDTWDSILAEQAWKFGVKTVIPRCNLVNNVGFGEMGTHTRDVRDTNMLRDSPDHSSLNLDDALSKFYFKVRFRHSFTPIVKVIIDFFRFSRRRLFEELLAKDALSRNEIRLKKPS